MIIRRLPLILCIAIFSMPVMTTQADPDSATLELLRAAERGDPTTTEIDLKLGTDPNSRDEFGTPALFKAAASGSVDTVRVLLDAGATNLNESHLRRPECITAIIASMYRGRPS